MGKSVILQINMNFRLIRRTINHSPVIAITAESFKSATHNPSRELLDMHLGDDCLGSYLQMMIWLPEITS
jgi:hypothetical protein